MKNIFVKFHIGKTIFNFYIIFENQLYCFQKKNITDNILIGDIDTPLVKLESSTKFLGVIISCDLKWNRHAVDNWS